LTKVCRRAALAGQDPALVFSTRDAGERLGVQDAEDVQEPCGKMDIHDVGAFVPVPAQ
jgi:hypothetical protein